MSNLKQKSIDAIIWNLIEKYGIQIIKLIIGVILARLLTPADYGLIGLITVFFALARVFINSGFGAAYIQKKDADQIDASTIFFFNLIVSFLLYCLLWISAPLIAMFYGETQLINLVRVSAIILIINSFSMMQIAKLTKEVNFKKKTIISLISTLISGTAGIIAALLNYGVWSLVLQQIIKALVNAMGLWLFYKWRPNLIFKMTSLKTLFSFSSWILLSSILRTVFDNIYILTIGKYFPIAQLGFYSKAKGYQGIISKQPSNAINIVSFPIFSKLQNDKVALKNSMRKFMVQTLFFIAPISITVIVIANPLIFVILTKKWMPMVPYLQLLLIIGLLYPIHSLNLQLLIAQGKTKLNFNISLIRNTLRVLNIIIMFRYGVINIIYGELFISLIALFINGYYTKKMIGYGIFEQLKDLFKIFFISGIAIIIGFLFVAIVSNDYLKIVIGILSTASSYLLFQFHFNKTFFIQSLDLVKIKLFNKKS